MRLLKGIMPRARSRPGLLTCSAVVLYWARSCGSLWESTAQLVSLHHSVSHASKRVFILLGIKVPIFVFDCSVERNLLERVTF